MRWACAASASCWSGRMGSSPTPSRGGCPCGSTRFWGGDPSPCRSPLSRRVSPPRESCSSRWPLEAQVLGIARRLADDLCEQLARRGFGARSAALDLFRMDGKVKRLTVRTARPLRDPADLARLFESRLASVNEGLEADFGFDLLRLTALSTESLLAGTSDLLGDGDPQVRFAAFAESVQARLGSDAVLLPQREPSTQKPEREWRLRPLQGLARSRRSKGARLPRRPRPSLERRSIPFACSVRRSRSRWWPACRKTRRPGSSGAACPTWWSGRRARNASRPNGAVSRERRARVITTAWRTSRACASGCSARACSASTPRLSASRAGSSKGCSRERRPATGGRRAPRLAGPLAVAVRRPGLCGAVLRHRLLLPGRAPAIRTRWSGRAWTLGHAAVGVADLNTLAGVVRAHNRAKEIWETLGLTKEEGEAQGITPFRLCVGARLSFIDGAPDVLVYPSDREAFGRLTRLLTKGGMEAGIKRGDGSSLTFDDLLTFAEGQNLILLPPNLPQAEALSSGLDRLLQASRGRVWMAGVRRYDAVDEARLDLCAEAAARASAPLIAVNDAVIHDPSRKRLHDVMTCIREHVTLYEAGRRLDANAERRLKSADEMATLFKAFPGAVEERTVRFAADCDFTLDELRYEYPDEPVPEGWTAQAHLKALSWRGAHKRWPDSKQPPRKARKQLTTELRFIEKMEYANYFLTVHDIVVWARSKASCARGEGRLRTAWFAIRWASRRSTRSSTSFCSSGLSPKTGVNRPTSTSTSSTSGASSSSSTSTSATAGIGPPSARR